MSYTTDPDYRQLADIVNHLDRLPPTQQTVIRQQLDFYHTPNVAIDLSRRIHALVAVYGARLGKEWHEYAAEYLGTLNPVLGWFLDAEVSKAEQQAKLQRAVPPGPTEVRRTVTWRLASPSMWRHD
jgi:hypothetical protein